MPRAQTRFVPLPITRAEDEKLEYLHPSPDGAMIATHRVHLGGLPLLPDYVEIIDASSGETLLSYQEPSNLRSSGMGVPVGWSRDGRFFAALEEEPADAGSHRELLAVFDTRGGTVSASDLPTAGGAEPILPVGWTDDGEAIYALSRVEAPAGDAYLPQAQFTWYRMARETLRRNELLSYRAPAYGAAIPSPDGRFIALDSEWASGLGGPLAVVRVRDGAWLYPDDEERVLNGEYHRWSDGMSADWLALGCWGREPGTLYAWRTTGRAEWDGTIWRLDVGTGSETLLADFSRWRKRNEPMSAELHMRPAHDELCLLIENVDWGDHRHAVLVHTSSGETCYLGADWIDPRTWASDGLRFAAERNDQCGWVEVGEWRSFGD